MTTNTIATHDHAPEAAVAPEEPVGQTTRSRVVFAIILAILCGAAGALMWAVSIAGTFGFAFRAALVLLVFNVAIMIYPIHVARKTKAHSSRVWIAVGAMVVAFVGTFITFTIVMAGIQPGTPGNGVLYTAGGIAFLFNATAAFTLAWVKPEKHDALPKLTADLEKEQVKAEDLHSDWQDAQDVATEKTSTRDEIKSDWEDLNEESGRAEKAVKEAKEALEKSAAYVDNEAAKKAHSDAELALSDHKAEIEKENGILRSPLSAKIEAAAQVRLDALHNALPDMERAVQEAYTTMKRAEKTLKDSPESKALQLRTDESIAANTERDDRADELDDAEKALKKATRIATEKGSLHEKKQAEVTRLTDAIREANENKSLFWRDAAFWAVLALLLAGLFYVVGWPLYTSAEYGAGIIL